MIMEGKMTNSPTTILVVDPNSETRTSVSRQLTSLGYTVLEAADGTRAMDLVREHKIRLVITELFVETPNSECLLRAMRQNRLRARTIAHTSHAQRADRKWATQWGASAYLIQPTTTERLGYVVSRLLAEPEGGRTRMRLFRRNTLETALSEIERGTLAGASSVVFGRPWWGGLTPAERNTYRRRAKRAGLILRTDALMASHFVELRGSLSA